MTEHHDEQAPQAPSPGPRPNPSMPRRNRTNGILVVGILVVAVLSALALWRISDLSGRVDDLAAAVAARDTGDLGDRIDTLASDIDRLSVDIDTLAAQVTGLSAGASSPITVDEPTSGLPRFEAGVQDTAVGLAAPDLSGAAFPGGDTYTASLEGPATIVLMFAHWCPYCQQEMPIISDLWQTRRDEFPDVQVVAVSTAQDPSRGNPEIPYLEELQLPFPVIVDEGNELAARWGLSAFPYWVFVGPDGTVIGRATGLIPEEALTNLFDDLQTFASENG